MYVSGGNVPVLKAFTFDSWSRFCDKKLKDGTCVPPIQIMGNLKSSTPCGRLKHPNSQINVLRSISSHEPGTIAATAFVFLGPSCELKYQNEKRRVMCMKRILSSKTLNKFLAFFFSACDHFKGIFQRPGLILAPAKWSFHSTLAIFSPSADRPKPPLRNLIFGKREAREFWPVRRVCCHDARNRSYCRIAVLIVFLINRTVASGLYLFLSLNEYKHGNGALKDLG